MKFVLSGLSRFSLSVRLLVISLGMFLALILVSSVSVISSVNKNLSSIGTAKAEAFVQFLRTSSGSYITNYDITALNKFVKELEKNEHFDFLAFYDPEGAPISDLTNPKEELLNTKFIKKEVVDAEGNILGFVEIGYNSNWSNNKLKEITSEVIIMGLIGLLVVGIALGFLMSKNTKRLLRLVPGLELAVSDAGRASGVLTQVSAKVDDSAQRLSSISQQTSAAMEEFSSMLKRTEVSAGEGKQESQGVKNLTTNGLKTVEALVSEMEALNEVSRELENLETIFEDISAKTNVINDIVFKTQLLSFNASIEAARAGQHGRGFSVVAEEIGSLATLSGGSAMEITNLLNSSRQQVEDLVKKTESQIRRGKDVSDETLEVFRNIDVSMDRVNQKIDEISDATMEQTAGIQQTVSVIANLGETALVQAATTKEISELASDIERQSSNLKKVESQVSTVIKGNFEPTHKKSSKKKSA
ncbi:MAG: methyl-accepting chemotaxis protein [Bdellovibrionota bacterium]